MSHIEEMDRLMLEFTYGERLVLLHAALAELRALEWLPGPGGVRYCPRCRGFSEDGHKGGCGLAAVLKRASLDPRPAGGE